MFASPTRAFAPARCARRCASSQTPRIRAGLLDAFRSPKASKHVAPAAAADATTVARLERAIALTDVRDGGAVKPTTTRRAIMAGNWKMNPKTASEAATLAALVGAAAGMDGESARACEVLVCPPAPFIADVARIVRVRCVLCALFCVCARRVLRARICIGEGDIHAFFFVVQFIQFDANGARMKRHLHC